MVTDFKNIPSRAGCIKTLDRFDHSFFRVNRKQAEQMDIASRMLLEKTFEAIIDAGNRCSVPASLTKVRLEYLYLLEATNKKHYTISCSFSSEIVSQNFFSCSLQIRVHTRMRDGLCNASPECRRRWFCTSHRLYAENCRRKEVITFLRLNEVEN